jgi:hypothetical protein
MKRVLFLVLVIGMFQSIHAQHETASPINQELYHYIFGTGSYWVYQNDSTLVIDSLVQTSLIHDATPPVYFRGQFVIGPVEYYQMHYQSKTLNYNTWDHLIGCVIVEDGTDWASGWPWKMWCEYRPGAGSSSNNSGSITIEDTLYSMKLGQNTFYHISKVLVSQPWNNPNMLGYYYYSKGVGMIKKELFDATGTQIVESWSLINWNTETAPISIPEDHISNTFQLYPNPVNDVLIVRFDGYKIEPHTLTLYNNCGVQVLNSVMDKTYTELIVADLSAGLYILQISDGKSVVTKKIMKI